MSNTTHHAAPRHSHPPRNNPAHLIHTAANECISPKAQTIWHYKVTKYQERNQPHTSPHEMLIEFAKNLQASNSEYSVIHQKTDTITTVSMRDIEADTNIYNYVSSCTYVRGAKSTTLLVRITNNHHHVQHMENPIEDLA